MGIWCLLGMLIWDDGGDRVFKAVILASSWLGSGNLGVRILRAYWRLHVAGKIVGAAVLVS